MLREKHPFPSVLFTLAWVLCGAWLAGACASAGPSGLQMTATLPSPSVVPASSTPARPTATVMALITPASDLPAAGICGGPAESNLTRVEIYPDIPSPRCLKVTGSQQLQVANRTDLPLEIDLGPFHGTVAPGETYLFTTPLGTFLAPGVHRMSASPFFGPELWLEE